ncbi:unnamed protein product, partial [Discosporangium mesarthrocarpum]
MHVPICSHLDALDLYFLRSRACRNLDMRSVNVAATLCVLGTSRAFYVPLSAKALQTAGKYSSTRVYGDVGRKMRMAVVADAYKVEVKGEENTESFRAFFNKDGKVVSPWHDIPLKAGPNTFNYICEIPKYSKAKMEIATKEENNPIAQDMKKGKLRFYHGPIFWNYGYLPQTWEDPNIKHPELGVMGDGDPVDVVEIGSAVLKQGAVKEVKALGCLAMIDDGELDWKVIAVDVEDPLAAQLNDVQD